MANPQIVLHLSQQPLLMAWSESQALLALENMAWPFDFDDVVEEAC